MLSEEFDREQRNFILPISQQEFWTTEDSYAPKTQKLAKDLNNKHITNESQW